MVPVPRVQELPVSTEYSHDTVSLALVTVTVPSTVGLFGKATIGLSGTTVSTINSDALVIDPDMFPTASVLRT